MSERLWSILVDSFFKILLPGITITIPLTVISFSIALVIATVVAIVQIKKIKLLKTLCRFYIWVIRGTPLLVQLFVVFYGLPSFGIIIDPLPAAIIVFSINEGAYAAEIIRAAIEAIPKGQTEASLCLGLSYVKSMRHVVLPQAFKIAFPSLSNSLIAMVKDTSLAANITVCEMFMKTQQIVARTWEALPLYLLVGFIYLMFCTILTKLQSYGEKKLNKY